MLSYLKNNQLPAAVAKRVITFYRWQNMNQFDEKSVLSDLPVQLRKEIFDNLYNDALDRVPIFRGCSVQFMTEAGGLFLLLLLLLLLLFLLLFLLLLLLLILLLD